MRSIERELKGYIDGSERMSGMDSYDSAEGDLGAFSDEGSYADGGYEGSYADGGGSPMQSNEYVLQYQNTTASDVTAYLFGFNDYFGSTNYGNPTAVVITNLQGGTYGRLLAQSNNKNFAIGRWRFQCTTASQLQVTLTVNYVDGNGITTSVPFNLSVLRDSYQQQSDILDAARAVPIDGNTYISFTLKASATLTITMYPTQILSGKAQLRGLSGHGRFVAPKLSGKNAPVTVIQTSQDVKSITK